MPGRGSKGPWNKWMGPAKRGGVPFMPRKPLDALEGLTLASAGQVSFLTPVRMPHGECGVWGGAPEG